MSARFEYKFVRVDHRVAPPGWFKLGQESLEYQEVVAEHAADGWRLVQVFAPGIIGYGTPKFYELILERELPAG